MAGRFSDFSRALPFNEQLPDNAAPDRCELCGGVRSPDGTVDHTPHSGADVLREIAHVYDEDPEAAGLLLKRIVHPDATQAEISKHFGHSRKWAADKARRLAERWPSLAPFLALEHPQTRSQKARRKSERLQSVK